uniref:60S ribosomal protein L4 n=1 Tax=Heterorhabditis bacteriophora TaxID=37862 RepID=A0A1I7X0V0_HETBA
MDALVVCDSTVLSLKYILFKREIKKAKAWKSSRKRKQTLLHRAPDFKVKTQVKKVKRKNLKNNKINMKPTLTIKRTGKHLKKISKKSSKIIPIVKKVRNDKLTPRKVKVYKENPFLHSSVRPDYVSAATYPRWLIRALIRKDTKELQNLMSSNK